MAHHVDVPALNAPEQKPWRFEWRMSLVLAALFMPLGVHAPYFPLWLETAGFDVAEIGIVLSLPMFARVVTTPFVTALADRASERATLVTLLCAASFAVSLGYFLTPSFAVVLAVSLILAVVWSPQVPITDSLAVSGVRRFGSDYPKMRIWGSIAFFASSFGVGYVISATGEDAIVWLIAAGFLGALLASLAAPRLGPVRRPQAGAARLFGAKGLGIHFLLCVAGAGIINASHAYLFGFVSIYWKSIGIDASVVGVLWGWSVVAEILLFLVFKPVFGSLSAPAVLALAGGLAAVRWAAFPLVGPVGLGIVGFFLIQTFHAFSTGLVLIGVQKLIAEEISEERTGAAQGAAFFVNGLSFSLVTLLSGPLYQRAGVDGFYAMAVVAIFGLGLIVLAGRSAPQLRRRG